MSPDAQVAGATEAGDILSATEVVGGDTGQVAGATQEVPATNPSGGAWTLAGAFGLFNILAGLMLVAAFVLFFGG